MSKKIDKDVKMQLDHAVSELKKIKEVQAVYLFGSQASGKARPYSDIDICIFTKQPLSWKTELKMHGVGSKKVSVSLFHKLPVYIQYRIMKEGVSCYVKNEKFMHRTIVSTVKNYLDFKPTLDRHFEIALKGV